MGPGRNEIYIASSIWYGNNQSGRRKVNIKKCKLLFSQFTNLLLAEFGNSDDFISKKG